MKRERSPGQIQSLLKAQETAHRIVRRMTKAQRRKRFQAFKEAGTVASRKYWTAYRLAKEAEAASGAQPAKRKFGRKKATARDAMSTT
jgi:hypothetical protein